MFLHIIYMKVKTHSLILYTFNAAFPVISTFLLAEVAKPMAVSKASSAHPLVHPPRRNRVEILRQMCSPPVTANRVTTLNDEE
jgi:hypothetical protein